MQAYQVVVLLRDHLSPTSDMVCDLIADALEQLGVTTTEDYEITVVGPQKVQP